MALPFKISSRNLGEVLQFGFREGAHFLVDWVRREPPRAERALEWVKQYATPGDPDSVIAVLDEFGRSNRFLMNVGDRKGILLDAEVAKARPERAMELGAFCGYSAVRIAKQLREWDGKLTSIEISRKSVEVSTEMVALAGLAETVEFRQGSAAQVIPTLAGPYDLVFIDHWKDQYLPDLRCIEAHGLLVSGSVVVADNVGFFDASEYLVHVRESSLYDSTHHESSLEYRDDLGDAVEVSVFR